SVGSRSTTARRTTTDSTSVRTVTTSGSRNPCRLRRRSSRAGPGARRGVVGRAAGRRAPADAADADVERAGFLADAPRAPDAGCDADDPAEVPRDVGLVPEDPRVGPVPGRAAAPGRGGRREEGMGRLWCPGRHRPGSTRG